MNNIGWKQKNSDSNSRYFETEEEKKEFEVGIIKIDLFDTVSKVLHSHKEEGNTLAKTERVAKLSGLDLKELGYSKSITVKRNNKKFLQKIKRILVVDSSAKVGGHIVNSIEELGHSADCFICLDTASQMFLAHANSWDYVLTDAHIKTKVFKNVFEFLLTKILRYKRQQKMVIFTEKDAGNPEKFLALLKNKFDVTIYRKGQSSIRDILDEVA